MSVLASLDDDRRFADWRVLCTGSTGFLGGHLCRALRDRCELVVGLARDHVCARDHFPPEDKRIVAHGDLSSVARIERIIAEHECNSVFHLAAQTQVSTAQTDPTGTFEANVRGTWNVLEACRRQGVRRVIIASSDKAYSDGPLPYHEYQPLRAHGIYATSKACADFAAQAYAYEYGIPVVIIRAANLYGPGHANWSTLIPGTIRSVLRGERPVLRSNGLAMRDYLHVEDAVNGYLAAAGGVLRGAFNLGTGAPHRAIDVVRLILRLMGSDLEPDVRGTASGEIESQWLDATKAREAFGWTARDLETGLGQTIPWYRERCK